MADPIDYRDKGEEAEWREKDPLTTFKQWALEQGYLTEEDVAGLVQEVEREVDAAVRFAEESPEPPLEYLVDDVYA